MQTIATWQVLIATLLGAALTFAGVWWNSRSNFKQLNLKLGHEEKLQRQQLSRERLEELYGLIGKWDDRLFAEVLHTGMLVQGLISHEEYLEHYPTTEVENLVDYTRLEMIVGIYGKSFKSAYEDANEAKKLLVALEGEVERKYLDGLHTEQILASLMEAHATFQHAVKVLKEKIAESVLA